MPFHLLVNISSHGFGHLAMTTPVLNRLNELADINITVRCELPERLIRSRLNFAVNILSASSDFGMVMKNSLDVDLEKSELKYQRLHECWDDNVLQEKEQLLSLKPDLIVSNVSYLTIAAARGANIPCVAYCSLNWLGIFKDYFDVTSERNKKIISQIQDAYNSAEIFCRTTPSMEMAELENVHEIGLVAKQSENQRDKINQVLGLDNQKKLVIVAPGGVETPVPIDTWPKDQSVHWITSWDAKTQRNDVTSIQDTSIDFNTLLASCDAVITKPGYGTVSETVTNGIPALYVKRGDWAEEPFMVDWWLTHGNVREISRNQFYSGDVLSELKLLWQQPEKPRIEPAGIDKLANLISKYFPSELMRREAL